jgi:endoglucanase
MENLVVNGLDVQPMSSIAAKISELGFNCVRLPFALDTFFIDPVIPEVTLAANPDLVGKTAMEIFDATVQALTDQGLIILLNNHVR